MVKNGCGQAGDGTLKLTVSEELIDGWTWSKIGVVSLVSRLYNWLYLKN